MKSNIVEDLQTILEIITLGIEEYKKKHPGGTNEIPIENSKQRFADARKEMNERRNKTKSVEELVAGTEDLRLSIIKKKIEEIREIDENSLDKLKKRFGVDNFDDIQQDQHQNLYIELLKTHHSLKTEGRFPK